MLYQTTNFKPQIFIKNEKSKNNKPKIKKALWPCFCL